MLRHVRYALFASALTCIGCSDGDDGGNENPGGENMASFDVTGEWTGTAVGFAEPLEVTLVLDNNGGNASGMALSGTLDIEGYEQLAFENAFVTPLPGATRQFLIDASDDEGYAFRLNGQFTSKRVVGAQLSSTHPDFKAQDIAYLETDLEKSP